VESWVPGSSPHSESQRQVAALLSGSRMGPGDGWFAPSRSRHDWKWLAKHYGGSDGAIFQSIHSGRPKGMPAFGGLLSPEIIWKLVTYLQSLPVPKSVPTQAW